MWLVETLTSFMVLCRRRGCCRPVDGQPDVEGGALADFGLEVQRAAVLVDDHVASDGESLASALAHGLGGEERIEDARAHLDRDSIARVADRDLHDIVEHSRGDL